MSPSSSTLESPPVRGGRTWRLVIGIPLLGLGCLALAAPFLAGMSTAFVLGLLMLASGLLEVVQAFAVRARRVGNNGVGMIIAATRSGDRPGGMLSDGCINVLLGLLIASQWPVSGLWIIGIYVGFRILASGWSKILGRDHSSGVPETEAAGLHPDPRLRLRPHLPGHPPPKIWPRRSTSTGRPSSRALSRFASRLRPTWCVSYRTGRAADSVGAISRSMARSFRMEKTTRGLWNSASRCWPQNRCRGREQRSDTQGAEHKR
jgi:uncharacterized membrane protein HdeD (DUF308 family)